MELDNATVLSMNQVKIGSWSYAGPDVPYTVTGEAKLADEEEVEWTRVGEAKDRGLLGNIYVFALWNFFCLGLGDGDMATEGASRLIAKPDKQNAGRRSGTARYGQ